jgi:NADPH:quinone reductase-like Zn-dependent oxidoreductase
MKAIVYTRYGGPEVLELREIPKPTPKDDEVLIKVRATTVTAADWRLRTLHVPRGFGLMVRLAVGISRPRRPILGFELSGDIEAVGKAVRKFQAGDQVFANCIGSYVEYKCMPEDGALALKPVNLSYEEAAAISFGGVTALTFFRSAKIQKGDKVLINGASVEWGPPPYNWPNTSARR